MTAPIEDIRCYVELDTFFRPTIRIGGATLAHGEPGGDPLVPLRDAVAILKDAIVQAESLIEEIEGGTDRKFLHGRDLALSISE